jgi:hypothetical protein
MKIKKAGSIAIIMAFVCINAPQVHAGFGSLAKAAAGGALGTVTADSLNSDMKSGLDFFQKANDKYEQALGILQPAAQKNQEAATNDYAGAATAQMVKNEQLRIVAEEHVKNGKALSPEGTKLLKEGNEEFSKGIAKWVGIGAAVAIATKNAGNDAALVAAIPVAQQLISDLPKLKKTHEIMIKLHDLGDPKK